MVALVSVSVITLGVSGNGTAAAEVVPAGPESDVEIDTFLEASLSTRSQLDPVSLSADLHVVLDEHVTLALEHSARAANLGDRSRGLCIRDQACAAVYTPPTFAVGYRWRGPTWKVETRLGLVTRGMAPWRSAVEGSVNGRLQLGRGAVTASAAHWHALQLRDAGNAHRVHLYGHYWRNLSGSVRSHGLWINAGAGLRTATDTFPDAYRVPVSVGVAYRWPTVDLGAEYELARLIGSLNDPKPRFVGVFVTVRPAIDLHQRRAPSHRER